MWRSENRTSPGLEVPRDEYVIKYVLMYKKNITCTRHLVDPTLPCYAHAIWTTSDERKSESCAMTQKRKPHGYHVLQAQHHSERKAALRTNMNDAYLEHCSTVKGGHGLPIDISHALSNNEPAIPMLRHILEKRSADISSPPVPRQVSDAAADAQ
jgi:hypothetical protein